MLIDEINAELVPRYNFKIDLSGFSEIKNELDNVLDVDPVSLFKLNKEALCWAEYLSEIAAALNFYIDKYSVVSDTYKYLLFLSKKDKSEFFTRAPTYRISTRNPEMAMIELDTKIKTNKTMIEKLRKMSKQLYAYEKLMTFHYFRTNRLLRSIERRSLQTSL